MKSENEEECSSEKEFNKFQHKEKSDSSQFALNIIDKHLASEERELSSDLEIIEDRILKLQQLLHSIRYHASLNLYAYDRANKKNDETCSRKNSLNHPTIQQHIGKSCVSVSSFPNEEKVSKSSQKYCNDKTTQKNLHVTEDTRAIASANTAKVPDEKNYKRQLTPGEDPVVIGQRRRESFQNKIKFYLGNTYQYVKDYESSKNSSTFQWRINLRTQDQKHPIEKHISAVKYTLHESYAPNNVVTVKKPPFSLSQKGWGEFQVHVELYFVDARNKPIQIIHTLKLARNDDCLSYSGLWRLGNENLYEIWIYDKTKDLQFQSCKEKTIEKLEFECNEDYMKTKLQSLGVESNVSYKDNEGNLTLAHTSRGIGDFVASCSRERNVKQVSRQVDEVGNKDPDEISMKVSEIDIPVEKELIISSSTKSPDKGNNICNLGKSNLVKGDIDITKEPNPDLVHFTNEDVLSSTFSESDLEILKIHDNNDPTSAVDFSTIQSVSDPSYALMKKLSSYNICSPNEDFTNSSESVKLINVSPSLHSKSLCENFSESLNRETARLGSADVSPPAFETLFSSGSASNTNFQKMFSNCNNTRRFQQDESVIDCLNNDPSSSLNSVSASSIPVKNEYFSVNPAFLKSKITGLSTNENHESDNKLSNTESIFSLNKISNEDLFEPTRSSYPSKRQTQINLLCNENDSHGQAKQVLLSTLSQNFKVCDLSKRKLASATSSDVATLSKLNLSITDNDFDYLQKLKEKKLEIRALCVKCSSVEEVLRIYWRRLQCFLSVLQRLGPSSTDSPSISSHCSERSVEFWLAREIRKELKFLKIEGRECWSTANIVSWARKHLYITHRKNISYIFELEKKLSAKDSIDSTSTLKIELSCSDNDEKKGSGCETKLHDLIYDCVNIVDIEGKNKINSIVDEIADDGGIVMFTPDFMVQPIHFIDSVLSKVRNLLRPEEIAEGIKMDVAKYIMYKATLSFIEDVLRCAFSVAAAEVFYEGAEDMSENQSITIHEKHILTVLSKHREGFQALTQFGLGKRIVRQASNYAS